MNKKLIITIAPTGNTLRKGGHPFVPISASEIGEDLVLCCQAGASIAHVHARDEHGLPSNTEQDYQAIWNYLDEHQCPIIREASLAGAETTNYDLLNILNTDTEMASLAMGSVNFLHRVNLFEPDFIRLLGKEMQNRGIHPELEIFDVSMVDNCARLYEDGYLNDRCKYNFILNVPGGLKGTIPNLIHLVSQLPKDALWGVTAMGESHIPLVTMAIIMGGHVRVGLEDRTADTDGRPISNVEQVQWIVKLAALLGREVATCAEARALLKLNQKK